MSFVGEKTVEDDPNRYIPEMGMNVGQLEELLLRQYDDLHRDYARCQALASYKGDDEEEKEGLDRSQYHHIDDDDEEEEEEDKDDDEEEENENGNSSLEVSRPSDSSSSSTAAADSDRYSLDQEKLDQITDAFKGWSIKTPEWATVIPEEEWKAKLLNSIQNQQTQQNSY
jgi:hypothetical protein